jgi:hypothetical protein
MEPKKRNTWIIVVIGVLVIACCCILALAAGAVVWVADRYGGSWEWEESFDLGDLGSSQRERIEESFAVGSAPDVEVTNFAGAVTVRSGEGEVVQVIATKKASGQWRLDRIEVDMQARGGGVVIRTRKDFDTGNASVDLEITVPADSQVRVDTGAGEVDVRGVTGQIEIHSGAGTVDIRDAQGPVRVGLGAGEIRYEGRPSGSCRFETGVGEINLRLPERPDVDIDVGTGLGSVDVDFGVDGSVAPRHATGIIGDGSQGSIFAHTGAGSVNIKPW